MANKPTIHLLRHAESADNLSNDFNHRDPGLTETGFIWPAALATTFPALPSIGVILISPLTRTIETTPTGFSTTLSNAYSPTARTTRQPKEPRSCPPHSGSSGLGARHEASGSKQGISHGKRHQALYCNARRTIFNLVAIYLHDTNPTGPPSSKFPATECPCRPTST